MNKPLVITLSIVSLPIYGMFASLLFGNSGDFLKSLRYLWTSDVVSAFRGDYLEDRWSEAMFTFWLIGCVIVVASEYSFVKQNLPEIYIWFEHW